MIPQRFVQFPRFAAVVALKQAARLRANVKAVQLVVTARLNNPEVAARRGNARLALRAVGIFRRGGFPPRLAAVVRTVQLAPVVAMIEARPHNTCARVGYGVRDWNRAVSFVLAVPVAPVLFKNNQTFVS